MRKILWIVLFSVCAASSVSAGDREPLIADSPETIRPLLIGASIPSITLARVEGNPVALADVIARQPSIIIFYRGGW
jgi:hypothetical protein